MNSPSSDGLLKFRCIECNGPVYIHSRIARWNRYFICPKCELKIDDALDEALHGRK